MIAAFSMLGDPRYLEEAIEKAPELPEVALVALALGAGGPDEVWSRRLRAADPDNSLVQFLSSCEALTRQDGSMAFEAMKIAQTLPEFDDYRNGTEFSPKAEGPTCLFGFLEIFEVVPGAGLGEGKPVE